MRMNFTGWRLVFAVGSLALASGCSDPPANNPPPADVPMDLTDVMVTDTGTDTGADVATDRGADAIADNGKPPVDADTDAATDLGPDDVAADVPADVPADVTPDDAAADVAADVTPDVAVDVTPDVPVDAGPGAGTCASPRALITLPSASPLTFMGTTTGGTSAFAGNRCQTSTGGPDHVYTLVVTARTGVLLSTDNEGTNFDTAIAIRRACADAESEVSCDDDSGSGTGRTTSSTLRAVLEPGTYSVIVDGFSTSAGNYTLSATTFTPAENATCTTARELTVGTALTDQTLTNAGGPGLFCAPGLSPGGQVFYAVTLPPSTIGTVQLSRGADAGSFTYALRAYAGCDATSCLTNGASSASPYTRVITNGGATPRRVILSVAADNSESAVSPFDIVVNTAALTPGQACDAPLTLTPGTPLTGQANMGAPFTSGPCRFDTGGQLYYALTIPAGQVGAVTATPTGTTLRQPVLRAFDTCTATACVDNTIGGTSTTPAAATVRIPNTGTTARTVLVSLASTSPTTAGTWDVSATTTAIAPGQTCETRLALTPGTPLLAQTNTAAFVTAAPCLTGSTGAQLFYNLTIPAGQRARVTANPTGTTLRQPVLRVFPGCTATACTDSATGGTSTTPASGAVDIPNNTTEPATFVVSLGSTSPATAGTWDVGTIVSPILPGQFCPAPITATPGMTLSGQDATTGLRPSTACLTTANGGQLFYRVTVPAGQLVPVRAVPAGAMAAWTPTLRVLSTCTATTCASSNTAASMGAAASVNLSNSGTMPADFIVSVSGTATLAGTFNLEVGAATTPPGYTSAPITAMCDDLSMGSAPVTPSGGTWSDDSTTPVTALPFTARFFATDVTHFSVSSNGFMQLWPSSAGTPLSSATNAAIPTAGTPNNLIAAFWDDLVPISGMNNGVLTATLGTAPTRRFVVQWRDWGTYLTAGAQLTFQAKVFEGTGVVEVHYCAMTATAAAMTRASGSEASVGTEDATGAFGTQVGFNTAGTVVTGMGYRLSPR
jgi:hypothetical protein